MKPSYSHIKQNAQVLQRIGPMLLDIGSEQPYSINCDEVIWWEQIKLEEALILTKQQKHEQAVIDAKEKELKSLTENKVFTWVEDECQNAISCK